LEELPLEPIQTLRFSSVYIGMTDDPDERMELTWFVVTLAARLSQSVSPSNSHSQLAFLDAVDTRAAWVLSRLVV
jgi:hypothetical protein